MAKPSARDRILDAAVQTLHERGFNGCGVQDITDAAGVPKGSFYSHFDSKEALAPRLSTATGRTVAVPCCAA